MKNSSRTSFTQSLKFLFAKAGKIAFACLLVACAMKASAQPYTSRLNRFQVDQITGCAPFTVNITNSNLLPAFKCPNCIMTFDPSFSQSNTYTYTYTTPGTYKLGILYPTTLDDATDDIIITVLPNIKPLFEAYTCSANGVVIKITDTSYDTYFVDYGDGSPVLTAVSGDKLQHSYGASALYNISVRGKKNNAADNCDPAVKSFQAELVLPAPVVTQLTALTENSVQLDFTAADNLLLRPQIAVNSSSSFQQLPDIYGVSSDVVPNVKVSQNYYCLRVNTHDACTGNDIPSEFICSLKFSTVAESDVDKLAWTTEGVITDYSITKNGAAAVTTPASSLDDTDIHCNTQYCYQVTSNYANGTKSISLSECVTAFTSKIPTLIDNASAVVSTSGVQLMWQQDPAFVATQYMIQRKSATDLFQQLAVSVLPAYNDPSYTTDYGFCYRVNYKDECKNGSPSGTAICPIRLSGTIDDANAVHLIWTQFRGWKDGVASYQIDRYDNEGNLLDSFSSGTDTTYTDQQPDLLHQVVSYRITAIPAETALTYSVSNESEFKKRVNLYYPTAFTPDHNSTNDTFAVRGFFIRKFEIHIFNRWGNMIYTSTDGEGWDGTYNGKIQPNDTYVWTATYTDLTGAKSSLSGQVLLITK